VAYDVVFDVRGVAPGNYTVIITIPITYYVTGQNFSTSPCASSQATVEFDHYYITVTGNTDVSLVDPVPDLMSGNVVLASSQLGLKQNLTLGRTVSGIASDGVAQIVIRISTNVPNEQFRLTVLNDQNPPGTSGSADEDGAIGSPGASVFTANQITVSAGAAAPGQLAYAFAVYRAPKDFGRPLVGTTGFKPGNCEGVPNNDDRATCRTVSIQVQDVTTNTNVGTYPIIVVRPLVVLIHGLWGYRSAWDNFSPLVTGKKLWDTDARFTVVRADYAGVIGSSITASQPDYPPDLRNDARENSLGIEHNASSVRDYIAQGIRDFRTGGNRLGLSVAAAQADLVGHSQGGLIARAMVLDSANFLTGETFGQGYIHKLITIDTPHLGSPVATQLLLTQENAGCLWRLLAKNGANFTFQNVTLTGVTNPVNGAVVDLVDSPQSKLLAKLASQSSHLIPTSTIAGIYRDLTSLDSGRATKIRNWPFGCPDDPLAQKLTSAGWDAIFGQQPHDGLVLETSQLNNLTPSPGSQFFPPPGAGGYEHSQGLTGLGFSPPSVLDAGPIPTQTIFLLNRPFNDTVYYTMFKP